MRALLRDLDYSLDLQLESRFTMVANRESQSLGRRIRVADGKKSVAGVVLVCLLLCIASESRRVQDFDNHVRRLGALPSYRVHLNPGSTAAAGGDTVISERNFGECFHAY